MSEVTLLEALATLRKSHQPQLISLASRLGLPNVVCLRTYPLTVEQLAPVNLTEEAHLFAPIVKLSRMLLELRPECEAKEQTAIDVITRHYCDFIPRICNWSGRDRKNQLRGHAILWGEVSGPRQIDRKYARGLLKIDSYGLSREEVRLWQGGDEAATLMLSNCLFRRHDSPHKLLRIDNLFIKDPFGEQSEGLQLRQGLVTSANRRQFLATCKSPYPIDERHATFILHQCPDQKPPTTSEAFILSLIGLGQFVYRTDAGIFLANPELGTCLADEDPLDVTLASPKGLIEVWLESLAERNRYYVEQQRKGIANSKQLRKLGLPIELTLEQVERVDTVVKALHNHLGESKKVTRLELLDLVCPPLGRVVRALKGRLTTCDLTTLFDKDEPIQLELVELARKGSKPLRPAKLLEEWHKWQPRVGRVILDSPHSSLRSGLRLSPRMKKEVEEMLYQVDDRGHTPLLAAARLDQSYYVKKLLQAGAKGSACATDGENILHIAAQRGFLEVLQTCRKQIDGETFALLIKGVDKRGNTPLHVATWLDPKPDVVAFLIDAGCEVNVRNGEKEGARSPLDNAARHGHLKSCQLLLGSGAHIKCNGHWDTPLDLALAGGHDDVVVLLLDPQQKNGYNAYPKVLASLQQSQVALQQERYAEAAINTAAALTHADDHQLGKRCYELIRTRLSSLQARLLRRCGRQAVGHEPRRNIVPQDDLFEKILFEGIQQLGEPPCQYALVAFRSYRTCALLLEKETQVELSYFEALAELTAIKFSASFPIRIAVGSCERLATRRPLRWPRLIGGEEGLADRFVTLHRPPPAIELLYRGICPGGTVEELLEGIALYHKLPAPTIEALVEAQLITKQQAPHLLEAESLFPLRQAAARLIEGKHFQLSLDERMEVNSAHDLLIEGRQLIAKGNLHLGKAILRRGLNSEPTDLLRAEICMELQSYQEALELFHRLHVHAGEIQALIALGNMAEAGKRCAVLYGEQPHLDTCRVQMALAKRHLQKGEVEIAVGHLHNAQQILEVLEDTPRQEVSIALARLYRSTGRLREAEQLLLPIRCEERGYLLMDMRCPLEALPFFKDNPLMQAAAYVAARKYKQAKEILLRLNEDPLVSCELAKIAFAHEGTIVAQRLLSKIDTANLISPTQIQAMDLAFICGEIALGQRDWKGASVSFFKAHRFASERERPGLEQRLAFALFKGRQFEEAREWGLRSVTSFKTLHTRQPSEGRLLRWANACEQHAGLLYQLGQAAEARPQLLAAINAYSSLDKRGPKPLFLMAEICQQLGYDRATICWYQEALELAFASGQLLDRKEECERALSYLVKAHERGSKGDGPGIEQLLALAFLGAGDANAAVKWGQGAISSAETLLEGDLVLNHLSLLPSIAREQHARILSSLGRTLEAYQSLEKAIQGYHQIPNPYQIHALTLITDLCQKLGDDQSTTHWFGELLEFAVTSGQLPHKRCQLALDHLLLMRSEAQNGEVARIEQLLTLAYLGVGQTEQAEKTARQAIATCENLLKGEPNHPELRLALARVREQRVWLLYHLEQDPEVQLLRSAIEVYREQRNQRLAPSLYLMACISHRRGNCSQTIEWCNEALKTAEGAIRASIHKLRKSAEEKVK